MVCAVLTLASCDFIARTFSSPVASAHAEYVEGLADAALAATPIARSWIDLQALRFTNYRSLSTLMRTGVPGKWSSGCASRA